MTGFTSKPPNDDMRVVAITSVNPQERTAEGMTREHSMVTINCKYPVGGLVITPAVGEQWYVRRKATRHFTLFSKLPGNAPELNTQAVEGQVHIGSSGPLELRGSYVNISSPLSLAVYQAADRPGAPDVPTGAMIFDSELAKVIVSDGTSWRDMTGDVIPTIIHPPVMRANASMPALEVVLPA